MHILSHIIWRFDDEGCMGGTCSRRSHDNLQISRPDLNKAMMTLFSRPKIRTRSLAKDFFHFWELSCLRDVV